METIERAFYIYMKAEFLDIHVLMQISTYIKVRLSQCLQTWKNQSYSGILYIGMYCCICIVPYKLQASFRGVLC